MKDRLTDLTAPSCDVTAAGDSSAFLGEFLLKVDEVQKLIEKISHCVAEVKLRHSSILTELNPQEYMREELEQFNSDIKRTADIIQVKLKALEEENANSDSCRVYCRIQSTQHTALSLRFAEVMNVYNHELLSFRKKCKERIQRQLEISGRVVTEEETEVLLQNNSTVFTADILSGSRITGQALSEIESRHKDILCLEASIQELHDMFIDIALLVSSQGEMADNIEKTVRKAEDYVGQGKENVEKAVVYKKSWRMRLPPFHSLFKSKTPPVTSDDS